MIYYVIFLSLCWQCKSTCNFRTKRSSSGPTGSLTFAPFQPFALSESAIHRLVSNVNFPYSFLIHYGGSRFHGNTCVQNSYLRWGIREKLSLNYEPLKRGFVASRFSCFFRPTNSLLQTPPVPARVTNRDHVSRFAGAGKRISSRKYRSNGYIRAMPCVPPRPRTTRATLQSDTREYNALRILL